jgi:hypothetical protein
LGFGICPSFKDHFLSPPCQTQRYDSQLFSSLYTALVRRGEGGGGTQGDWTAGEGLLLGVFEQDQAQFLPDELDPLTYVPEAVAAEGQQRYPDTQASHGDPPYEPPVTF